MGTRVCSSPPYHPGIAAVHLTILAIHTYVYIVRARACVYVVALGRAIEPEPVQGRDDAPA